MQRLIEWQKNVEMEVSGCYLFQGEPYSSNISAEKVRKTTKILSQDSPPQAN